MNIQLRVGYLYYEIVIIVFFLQSIFLVKKYSLSTDTLYINTMSINIYTKKSLITIGYTNQLFTDLSTSLKLILSFTVNFFIS